MSSNKRRFCLTGLPSIGSKGSRKRPKANLSNTNYATNINSTEPSSTSTSPGSTSTSSKTPMLTYGKATSKVSGSAIISSLKGSMNLLLKGCGAFIPLESAVRDIVNALEAIEACPSKELPQWAIILSAYLSEAQPGRMSKWVNNIVNVLRAEADYIKTRLQQWGARNLAKSEEETEALRQCYFRIEASFRHLLADATLSIWKATDDHLKATRLDGMHPAHDARYDSSFSDKIERQGCFSNTRVKVLETILQWANIAGAAKINWMSGMAGTGKTAVAYSICSELEKNGRLGASYFCSRASPDCRNVDRILPTIAYQLAQKFYPFRSSLCRMIGDEPSISQRNISVQFEYLIKSPILEAKSVIPDGLVVVIDGLDECVDSRTTRVLLELLIEHAGVLPLRFFLTSRPELNIVDLAAANHRQIIQVLPLHDIQTEVIKADIKTYLSTALAKFNLSGEQILNLAESAGVLFIYAVTLARYLTHGRPGSSTSTRLSTVLAGDSKSTSKKSRDIDCLYKTILDRIFEDQTLEDDELKLIQDVLWTVVCAMEPITETTVAVY